MNTIAKWFLLLGLFALISACFENTDGSGAPGCRPCNQFQKEDKYLGEVKLSDSSSYWLGFYGIPYQRWYKNTKGDILKYDIRKDTNSLVVYLNCRTIYDHSNTCCPEREICDYINTGNEIVTYNPQSTGVPFAFKREMDLDVEFISRDSFNIISKVEKFVLEMNGKKFYINPDTTYSSTEQKYHSKLKLNNGSINAVYEIIDSKADTTKVSVKGIYFTFGWGIVGVYYTNNELWAD